MRFQDKVVIVTGAASGKGCATAQRLFNEGARVALIDRNEDGLANAWPTCPTIGLGWGELAPDVVFGGLLCESGAQRRHAARQLQG